MEYNLQDYRTVLYALDDHVSQRQPTIPYDSVYGNILHGASLNVEFNSSLRQQLKAPHPEVFPLSDESKWFSFLVGSRSVFCCNFISFPSFAGT